MPFRSEAQRRLFHAKEARGEISKATVNKWESETKGDIPKRVEAKKRAVKYKQSKGSV